MNETRDGNWCINTLGGAGMDSLTLINDLDSGFKISLNLWKSLFQRSYVRELK